MPSPPSPPLIEDVVEEILLRFPPQEPDSLVRAALVSKQWCRLISGPGFRRRFREFHRTPPILGFLRSVVSRDEGLTRFEPTTAFRPRHANHGSATLDARHGRVLLWRPDKNVLMVWDPITDDQKELPIPLQHEGSWAAAILCSAAGGGGTCDCDHLDCHRGPFLVVYVVSDVWTTFFCTYSSDVDAWSEIISMPPKNPPDGFFVDFDDRIVLVGNTLYFGGQITNVILKCNLGSREMSWIRTPDDYLRHYVLTAMEEGRLGLVTVIGSEFYVWLRKDGHQLDAGWVQTRVIELKSLLPFDDVFILPSAVAFADGLGIVLLRFNNLLYTIDLKSYEVKELCQTQSSGTSVFPYMSFYIPALEPWRQPVQVRIQVQVAQVHDKPKVLMSELL